jgi:hypothetical protein
MIEVLKQALEALQGSGYYDTTQQREAITSLRQAIAELESQEPVGEFGWAANIPNTIGEVHWKNGSPPIGTKLYTHPPQRTEQEPVAFKIYKPTPPRHAIPNVRDAELPWVYDQDPSSGNVASMWVTPVKHTIPPQRTWVGSGDLEDSNSYLNTEEKNT